MAATTACSGPGRGRRRGPGATAPLLLALAVALSACGGEGTLRRVIGVADKQQKFCPGAVVLGDARHLIEVRPGGNTKDDVRVASRITNPVATCDYKDDRLVVDLNVPIDVARGPQLKSGRLDIRLPYFVAVADRYNRILGKETFVAEVSMGSDEEHTSRLEEVTQVIPLAEGQQGTDFVVYVGFQLTREQVEFNRRHRL